MMSRIAHPAGPFLAQGEECVALAPCLSPSSEGVGAASPAALSLTVEVARVAMGAGAWVGCDSTPAGALFPSAA